MKRERVLRRETLRWALNLCTAVLAALGICLDYMDTTVARNSTLYFTTQSNIWLLAICLVVCWFDWRRRPVPRRVFVVKFIFTVAITLTGVVYNLILAPQYGVHFGSLWRAYNTSVVLLHVVVPILGVVSFLWFDGAAQGRGLGFAGLIMPLLYFAGVMLLSLTGYSEGMFADIGGGSTKFPYFFMDYERNGWFTLSDGLWGLGVFYWIAAGLLLTLGLSTGLLWLKRRVGHTP